MAHLVRPHDQFFKKLLDQPEAAGALLRERLPAEVARRLAPTRPELVPGSFIDPALHELRSDRLYRVRLLNGRPALVYALIEHKSAPDWGIGLQLLGYMVLIWQHWLTLPEQVAAKRRRPLPPIFPLVVHTGGRRWTVPLRFADILGLTPELRPLVLDFPYSLLHLVSEPDATLSQDPGLRVGLLILKLAAGKDDATTLLRKVLKAALALGPDDTGGRRPAPSRVTLSVNAMH